jgi:hypothetical protein
MDEILDKLTTTVYNESTLTWDNVKATSKDLIYKSKEDHLLIFTNLITGKEEYLNKTKIIRMEAKEREKEI